MLHFWFRRRGTFSPCSRNWPCGPTYLQSVTGLIPSSLQSSDTEVSRCAIAAWASRTWAFDSANFPAVLASARTRGLEPGHATEPRKDSTYRVLKLGAAVFARQKAGLKTPAEFLAHVSPPSDGNTST